MSTQWIKNNFNKKVFSVPKSKIHESELIKFTFIVWDRIKCTGHVSSVVHTERCSSCYGFDQTWTSLVLVIFSDWPHHTYVVVTVKRDLQRFIHESYRQEQNNTRPSFVNHLVVTNQILVRSRYQIIYWPVTSWGLSWFYRYTYTGDHI